MGRGEHVGVCWRWVGGRWDSLSLGELIQRICSASGDGERGPIGTQRCAQGQARLCQRYLPLSVYPWAHKLVLQQQTLPGSPSGRDKQIRLTSATRGLTACRLDSTKAAPRRSAAVRSDKSRNVGNVC